MNQKELQKILDLHKKWINGDTEGQKADLGGANLSNANLRCADLSNADLSGADLSDANLGYADLSGTQGVLDAIDYISENFERTDDGYIVYKTFGSNYKSPGRWRLEKGEVITESCNYDRTCDCGCGINVATLEWVRKHSRGKIYKLLIKYEWLAGVVVPYMTDGKIRTSRAQIIGVVD